MFDTLGDGMAYLTGQGTEGLLATFWFVVLLEIPRYLFSFLAVLVATPRSRPRVESRPPGLVSIIVAGHNEAETIKRCVYALRDQTLVPDEIVVVSDGSTDTMPQRLQELHRQGLVDQVHCTDLRGGKAAAFNLGTRRARGDIIVNVDADCSFDRHALEEIVRPLARLEVGAVCGNILVRNAKESLVAQFQAIEYLITISLGKRAAMLTDQVTCVSGAFGAFRRKALDAVAGTDPGGGEDLDVTMRLRKAGWRIVFAPDAICYTDVPATLRSLLFQRRRWERDALGLRFRKHRDLLNPFSPRFKPLELLHEIEFIVFSLLPAAIFPLYLVWLFSFYGNLAWVILLAAQTGMCVLDLAIFALAGLAAPRPGTAALLLYLPGYTLYNGYVMRLMRLLAYLEEWIFDRTRAGFYVPEKVQATRYW